VTLPMQKASYRAHATATPISFGEVESTGNLQISVEFDIVDERYPGERLTWSGTLGGGALERCLEALMIAGWQGEDVSELEGVPASSVLTEDVSLACEPDTFDGKTTLKVQWVNRLGGRFAFKKPVQGSALKALGAQIRATAKSVRAQVGAPRKPNGGGGSGGQSQPHPNAPGQRDDIPF
jgi:hypothetical protein